MPKVIPTMFLGACLVAFSTGCATPSPAGAEEPVGDPAANASAAEATSGGASTEALPDDERVVCKEVRKTGTRFGTRECLTVAQWEALQRGAREGVSEVQRRASQQQDMPGQGGG